MATTGRGLRRLGWPLPDGRGWGWVVCAVLVAGCASAPVGGVVDVDFLWVKGDGSGQGLEGGGSHAVLRVDPSDSGMMVGIFESRPAGLGDSWRVAMWMAALTGTLQLGFNPLNYRYSVETESLEQRVDGPSAGGLFAVAVMAALTGRTIRPDATMSGSVNPDGTVGPVGGLSEKLAAAAALSKRRFCFPAGQRMEKDSRTGQEVDLVETARELGMEGYEVRDLVQAYHCLTGRELPRRPILVRARMALPSAVYQSLSGMSNTWNQRVMGAIQPETVKNSKEPADSASDTIGNPGVQSRKLGLEGMAAASWFASIEEYRDRRSRRQTAELWALFQSDRPADAVQKLTTWTASNDRSLQKLFHDLGDITLDSVDRVIWLLEAYEGAVTASVYQGYAVMTFQELLETLKKARDESAPSVSAAAIQKVMLGVIRDLVLAEVQTLMARDLVVLARNVEGKTPVLEEDLDQATQLFHGAALANMEFLESWLISDAVERTGKPAAEIRKNLARKDADYRLALMNLRLPESDSFLPVREGRTRQMARLSGALSSFFASSTLMASRYSLRRSTDEGGTDKALDAALVSAEDKARENAARALTTMGFIPQGALVAYQIALVQQRSQERKERWKALESYWRSSMWSQVAMVLWETTGKRGNQHRPSTRRRTP